MLNYAEWIDEDSHRDALARSGRGTVGNAPEWRDVQEFHGLTLRAAVVLPHASR
ncbi:hypothetical protein [Nonomuraea sp. B1E8]|uniref:hypothetical protein n=1 Tax=unclassified Nonomuraea TaxID=2593643 RepID=UPI00325F3660